MSDRKPDIPLEGCFGGERVFRRNLAYCVRLDRVSFETGLRLSIARLFKFWSHRYLDSRSISLRFTQQARTEFSELCPRFAWMRGPRPL